MDQRFDSDERRVIAAIKKIARFAGKKVLTIALVLYHCMMDSDTPFRIKALILGDLAYFISPLDTVPDLIPVWGYSDDFALMTATLAYIAAHIKPEHREKAARTAEAWLGE